MLQQSRDTKDPKQSHAKLSWSLSIGLGERHEDKTFFAREGVFHEFNLPMPHQLFAAMCGVMLEVVPFAVRIGFLSSIRAGLPRPCVPTPFPRLRWKSLRAIISCDFVLSRRSRNCLGGPAAMLFISLRACSDSIAKLYLTCFYWGYRTIIARHVAKSGDNQMCLCATKYQGGKKGIALFLGSRLFGSLLTSLKKYRAITGTVLDYRVMWGEQRNCEKKIKFVEPWELQL